ncbi:MAG: ATP-binding cassette domain-containing protein [Rhodoferax sp.]|uniref:ABC transporter ATP-binding protein n=1 Tax=Rhodoferax sp. TaxID=50421 RepID=UPI002624C2C9|nr:ATP-binding cassette domain-containing protein [Rhodoferax sp.]MDD5333489.1 ATP-binding cassette domain-containing protein [Rhodoferax sp.]
MSGQGQLQVRDLALRFAGQQKALFNIPSLDLSAGGSLGICGVSGAGKTTLFHCLAGIATPTAGQICWGGTDICTLPAPALGRWRHSNLGLVFQDFHLIDGLSTLDNVLLPAYFDRWRPAAALRQRARELLAASGISAFDRLAAQLSRGERQRVALARALLLQPSIVMADEPTASLDPDHRTQIGDLLTELVRAQGATLIVISHEPELLARMQRCLRLQDGALQQLSPSP